MVRFTPASLTQLYCCIYVNFVCQLFVIETCLIQNYVDCPGNRSDYEVIFGQLTNTELSLKEVLCTLAGTLASALWMIY